MLVYGQACCVCGGQDDDDDWGSSSGMRGIVDSIGLEVRFYLEGKGEEEGNQFKSLTRQERGLTLDRFGVLLYLILFIDSEVHLDC